MSKGRSQLARQARVVPEKIGMFTWPLGLYGWDEGYHRIRRNTDFQPCKPALQGWVRGPRSLGLLGTARLTVSCWGVRMTAERGGRQPEG